MRTAVLATLLMLASGLIGFYTYTTYFAENAGTLPEDAPIQRPAIVLNDLAGTPQAITQWDGKPLVVNFWATWCAPCREELPLLQALQEEYGGQGLQVIGIAIDEPDAVAAFAAELGIQFPVLVGEQDAYDALSGFGAQVQGLPYTAFVSRSGLIVGKHSGLLHREQALKLLDLLF